MLSQSLARAQAWFTACAEDNSRAFWATRKEAYARDVRAPFLDLLRSTGEDADAWRVYRPHQDVRFTAGAGPLKTFLGALDVEDDGTGRYLQVDARGLLASSGLPYLAPDQLPRWREAVDLHGDALDAALASARAAGAAVKSGYPEPLKRVPRGFDPTHVRGELLRWKGVEAWARRADLDAGSADWVRRTWQAGLALRTWLAEHVGPSTLPRPR